MPWVRVGPDVWVREGTVRCKDCETEVRAARQALIEESARIRDRQREEHSERAAKMSGTKPILDPRRLFVFYARNIAEEKMTLQSLADHLGIGRERVRQLEADTMRRMKAAYDFYRRKHNKEISDGTV